MSSEKEIVNMLTDVEVKGATPDVVRAIAMAAYLFDNMPTESVSKLEGNERTLTLQALDKVIERATALRDSL